jgi:hypothetical protein
MMMNTIYINRLLKLLIAGAFLAGSLTACEVEVDDNVPGVPPTGLFAAVGANQHSGEDTVQVATAIFSDGEPIDLVGGDVVQASTINDSILLLERGFFNGSYAANLPNSANLDQIEFSIVHEPIEARQNRWYPVDLINIDPGPGDLGGASATIELPPEPVITTPPGGIFTSIDDIFDINWDPLPAGDIIKVRSAITCDDGFKTSTYGTVATLADDSDDGSEGIRLDQFIYDLTSNDPQIDFITEEARAMLAELLSQLSNGVIDETFLANIAPVNPVTSECEIRLFLFRQRPGSFVSATTNGTIFGSRSAELTITYTPN